MHLHSTLYKARNALVSGGAGIRVSVHAYAKPAVYCLLGMAQKMAAVFVYGYSIGAGL